MNVINKTSRITIQYTLTTSDGLTLREHNDGDCVIQLGNNEILPSVEALLLDHQAGDTLQAHLPPTDAYGPIDKTAFHTVDIGMLPESCRTLGALADVDDDFGNSYQARIHQIDKKRAVLDFNHPLAGKTLLFHITIRQVDNDPPTETKHD